MESVFGWTETPGSILAANLLTTSSLFRIVVVTGQLEMAQHREGSGGERLSTITGTPALVHRQQAEWQQLQVARVVHVTIVSSFLHPSPLPSCSASSLRLLTVAAQTLPDALP